MSGATPSVALNSKGKGTDKMEIVIGEMIGALIIGWFGRNRKFGFWGFFFCALALTPLVGLIVLLASDPVAPDPTRQHATQPGDPAS